MKPNKIEVGESVSFFMTAEEAELLWSEVSEAGYEKNGEGLKAFLFFLLSEEDEEEDAEEGFDPKRFMETHGKDVEKIVKYGGAILKNIINKKG